MAGVIQRVEWEQSAAELYAHYRAEREVKARKRLHALWRVRCGETETEAAAQAGIGRRTLSRWLSWYRAGRLDEVLRRVPASGGRGVACRLSALQPAELVRRCAEGQLQSTPQVQAWVAEHWGVQYRYHGMYGVLARLEIDPKVPRPRADKADPKAQESWKNGGSPPN